MTVPCAPCPPSNGLRGSSVSRLPGGARALSERGSELAVGAEVAEVEEALAAGEEAAAEVGAAAVEVEAAEERSW